MCMDPATAAVAAAAISAASTAGQGIAGYMQGKATERAYKQAAKSELQKTALEEASIRESSKRFLANQRLQMLAQGGDIASGTNEAIATSDVRQLELDALMRRYEGEVEAENLKHEGRSAAREGAVGMGFSFLNAGAQALGGQPQQWQGFSGSGKSQMSKRNGGSIKRAS